MTGRHALSPLLLALLVWPALPAESQSLSQVFAPPSSGGTQWDARCSDLRGSATERSRNIAHL